MNIKLREVLKSLSDGEVQSISESFVNDSGLDNLRKQINSKSNIGEVNFSRRDISDAIINELCNRLLNCNIELGKRNSKVSFLKRLFKFRFKSIPMAR
jgi:hypothetical protein